MITLLLPSLIQKKCGVCVTVHTAGRKVLPQGMGNISALLFNDLSARMRRGTNVL